MVGSGPHPKVVPPGSPQWYATLRVRMQQRVQQLTASGATVFLLTQPPFVDLGRPAGPTSQDKDFERLNAFLTAFAANTPHVKLIDLSALVCPSGPPCPWYVGNIGVRGDGAHYTLDGSLWAARWLMPQLGIEALDKPENTLPVMKMAYPADGKVVKGTQIFAAVASFNVGVVKVEFQATGNGLLNRPIGTAFLTHNLRGLRWNSTGFPNGTYSIRAVGYDAAGASSASKGITVHVKN